MVGCGYLGEALTGLLRAEGRDVFVTRRTAASVDALAARLDVGGIVFDTAAEGAALPVWPAPLPAAIDAFCLLTPSALATPGQRARLRAWLDRLPLARAVLSSSTGIYAEGGQVSAESPVMPATPRERLLADIEAWWLDDPRAAVLRLAGIYGPGRVIGARWLREGTPVPGRADAWLNLIHRDDAAGLLRCCLSPHPAGRIEVGADGHPVVRRDYYTWLAVRLGVAPPQFEAAPADAGPGKRVDAGSTWQRRAWQPRYPGFVSGITQALQAADGP